MILLCLFSFYAVAEDFTPDIDTSCSACTQTPDPLIRYTLFVGSFLKALDSTSKVDYNKIRQADGAQGKVNTLIDYIKQEWDSYLWTFKREWRVTMGDVWGISFNTLQLLKRDLFADFARQTVVGLRTSALTRDIDKLEQLDESIDREASLHITNFVFSDPLSSSQIDKLQNIFSDYQDIFTMPTSSAIQPGTTYKDIIGWLNYTQRLVKNHITFSPKKDFKYDASRWVSIAFNPNRPSQLAWAYSCVIVYGGFNCNPTYGKTKWLWDEFTHTVGKELSITLSKFSSSARKLRALYRKKERDIYFKDAERWVSLFFNWSKVGQNNSHSNNRSYEMKQQQDLLKKSLDECYAEVLEKPDSYSTQQSFSLDNWSFGKIVSCRKLSTYEIKTPVNISQAETARIEKLQQAMWDHMMLVMSIDDEQDALIKLSSPLSVTTHQPLLSKVIYDTKSSLHRLIDTSIQWCLSFCSNLNAKVNCGSR